MPRISLIIAVYNSEKYLSECLDSLIAQTMTDWEALCVDDCSKDGSLALLRRYADRDSRIRVFQTDVNSGPQVARNVASDHIAGEYVCMLDSDDWLEPDALEKADRLFRQYPSTDAAMLDIEYFDEDSRACRKGEFVKGTVMSGREIYPYVFHWQVSGLFVVRASIHTKYPYDNSARVYGDENTTILQLLACREIRWCDGVYHYRQHSESITHRLSIAAVESIESQERMASQLCELDYDNEIRARYENHRWLNVINAYLYYYRNRCQLSSSQRKQALRIIREARSRIDFDMVERQNRCKFGYMPMRWSWIAFRLQEEAYFFMRRVMGRL